MTSVRTENVRKAPADVSIKAIRSSLLRAPVGKQDFLLVEVETDAGITGVGDATLDGNVEMVYHAVARLEGFLRGQDPLAGAEIWRALVAQNDAADAIFWAALGGIDMALWDIRGKILGVPAYQLAGGPTRQKVRIFAPLSGSTTAELAECAQRQYREGVRAFQFSVPPPPTRKPLLQYRDNVRQTLEKLREAIPDGEFIIGCNGKLSAYEVAQWAHALEPLRPLWLDEPFSDPTKGYARELAQATVIPLGGGRGNAGLAGFLDYLRQQTFDVLRPDIVAGGGITNVRKVAHLAESHYLALAPFNGGTPVATAAALQVAASVSNFYIQEIPWLPDERDRQMRADLLAQPLEVFHDGYVDLPSAPGLGIELNRESLERYRAAR